MTVASPDGQVRFVLASNAQGHLQYTVTFNAKNIIDPSLLGIVVDKVDLADGAQIGAAETYKVNETYPWYGAHTPRGGQLQRRQGRPDASQVLNVLYAGNPGLQRRRGLPPPGAGHRAPGRPTKSPNSMFRPGA